MIVKAKARWEAAVRGQRERRQLKALLDSETDPFLPCKGKYGNTLGWSRGSQRLSCVSGDFLIFMLHWGYVLTGGMSLSKIKVMKDEGPQVDSSLSLMRFGDGGMLFALYLLSLLLVRNYLRKRTYKCQHYNYWLHYLHGAIHVSELSTHALAESIKQSLILDKNKWVSDRVIIRTQVLAYPRDLCLALLKGSREL